MGVDQVSQSINSMNEVMVNAVNAQTKAVNDLTQANLQAKVAEKTPESGKGTFIDTMA